MSDKIVQHLRDYLWNLVGNRYKLGEININLQPSTKLCMA